MRVIFFFLIVTGLYAHAAPVVPDVPSGIEPGAAVRVFGVHDDWELMAEGTLINETDGRNFRDVTLGGYYQGMEHLKLGAFVRQAYGLRHDDDWISDNGTWEWVNTNGRAEDIVILDATPKSMLGEHLVGEVKTRYLFDTYNAEKTLLVRPGLTYFSLKDDQPFWAFFVQFEADFPLNYGEKTIYEQWAYLGALRNIGKGLDVGAFFALKWQTWGSSSDYLAKGGTPYTITTQTSVLCANVIYQFEM